VCNSHIIKTKIVPSNAKGAQENSTRAYIGRKIVLHKIHKKQAANVLDIISKN
jgi:hypothetical protein